MTAPQPDSSSSRRPPSRALAAWLVFGLAATLVVALGLLAAGWMGRRGLAERYAAGWLSAQGVPARVRLDTVELDRVSGSLSLGPVDAPTASVERFEARITVTPPLGVSVRAVTLHRPSLAATVGRDGRLSFGALDGLIGQLRVRPAAPGAPTPDVAFDGGVLRLATPAGRLTLTGGGVARGGRIDTLDVAAGPAAIQLGAATARLAGAALTMRTRGAATIADAHVALDSVDAPGVTLRGADVAGHLEGALDPARLTARGASLRLLIKLASAASAGVQANALSAAVNLDGIAVAWDGHAATLRGDHGGMGLLAGRLGIGPASLGAARVTASFTGLGASAGRGLTLAVASRGDASARTAEARLGGSPVSLSGPSVRWSGDVGLGSAASLTRLTLAVSTRASLPGVAARSPIQPVDGGEAALAEALRSVALSAPAVTVTGRPDDWRIGLGAPTVLAFAGGGRATLTPVGAAPVVAVLRSGLRGAFRLAVTGASLPAGDVTVSGFRAGRTGFDGQVAGDVAFSLPGFRAVRVRSAGRLRVGGADLVYDASACGPVAVARVDLGPLAVDDAAGQLCPMPGEATLSTGVGGWRMAGRFAEASGAAPALPARISAAAGTFDLRGGASPITGAVRLTSGEAADGASPSRYAPLRLAGGLTLGASAWSGRFDAATLTGRPLGQITLRHDPASGRGEAVATARQLAFAKGALQPGDLTPMAAALSPVTGAVDFTGRVAWAGDRLSSDGDLATTGLSLRSPVGLVTGLATRIHFTSLLPLETAPGQTVTAARVEAIVPLTELGARFRLTPEALDLEAAEATAEGGRVGLAPTRIPFDPKSTSHGVLTFTAFDLGKLIAATSLAEKVELDAVISGRLPYALGPDGLRFDNGSLAAIRPGRISIHRDALTTAPVTNAVQDMAFQALEALSFQQLDASVQSRPEGRLGVLFHIKGRFEPKTPQEAIVPVADLLSGTALKHRIPLPSLTPVELNLDTSLNFDQLLTDYKHAFSFRAGTLEGGASLHSDAVQR